MSDSAALPTFAAPPVVADQADPATGDVVDDTPQSDDDGLGDKGKQALARMKEQVSVAKKSAAEMAARLKEIEDRDKSELQKTAERAEAAEKALAAATAKEIRTAVGAAKGLTLSQSMRLQGSTTEELEADADAFLAEIKGAVAAPPGFQGGPRSSPQGPDASAQKFAEFLRG